jgi:opacity protein-like surface antigen
MKKLLMVAVVGVGLAGLVQPASADPVSGRKVLLKADKKILLLSKHDEGIVAPTPEELGSATSAFLTVCAENGQSGTFELDVAGFKLNKKGILKFKAKGKAPVKKVLIKSGRTLKVVGKDSIVPMVEGTELGGVAVRLSIGDQDTCTVFSEPSKDTGKIFKAKNGTAPADCDDLTLGCVGGSPSGAFLH